MFFQSNVQLSRCFANIVPFTTVTLNMINNTTFFHLVGAILHSGYLLSDSVVWFMVDVSTIFPKGPFPEQRNLFGCKQCIRYLVFESTCIKSYVLYISVVAVSVLLWCYKSASKARKRRLRKELELVPDPRIKSYLRFIANDFNVSDNAIIARASHSDQFLQTPLNSATHSGNESKSRVPVNVLPDEQSEVPILPSRHMTSL